MFQIHIVREKFRFLRVFITKRRFYYLKPTKKLDHVLQYFCYVYKHVRIV